MRDVPRIEGTPDPRRTSQSGNDEEIDPEKFKKVMKVDESDESQKRNKRNRAEQEEDIEDEEESDETSAPAPGFSDLMDETENRDSVFQAGPGTQKSLADPDESGPAEQSPFKMMASNSQKDNDVPNSPNGLMIQSNSTSSPIDSDDPVEVKNHQRKIIKETQRKAKTQLTQAIKIAKEMATQEPQKEKSNEKEKTAVPKALVEAAEKPLKRKDKTDELKQLAPHEIKKVEEEAQKDEQKQITTFEPEKKKIESHIPPADSHLIDLEKKKKQAQKSSAQDEQKQEDRKDREKETTETIQQIDSSMQPHDVTPIKNAEMPSYSSLSSKVYDLYERLVGLITIQQSTGKEKTMVRLNMPGSVFNKAEITLEKFESAPNTFHISMAGSPQAVELFNANMADLVAAFQDNKRAFEVNIQRPYLLKEHRHIIKRANDTEDNDKQGQQESKNEDRHAS